VGYVSSNLTRATMMIMQACGPKRSMYNLATGLRFRLLNKRVFSLHTPPIMKTRFFFVVALTLAGLRGSAQHDSLAVWRQELQRLRSDNQYKAAWVYAEKVEQHLLGVDTAYWGDYKKDIYYFVDLAERVGEVRKCVDFGEKFLALHQPGDTTMPFIETWHALSHCYIDDGQYEKGLEGFNACLGLVKKHHPNNYDKQAMINTSLCRTLMSVGQIAQAERLMDENRTLYKSGLVKKDCKYAHFLRGAANYYYNVNDYQEAARLLHEAMDACNEQTDKHSYHLTASLLASVVVQQGDPLASDFLLSAALPVLKERSGELGEMYVYGITTRLTILSDMGLFEQVVKEADYMQQLLENAGQQNSYNYVFLLRVKGYALLQLNEQKKGLELLEKSYEIATAGMPQGDINLFYAINNLAFAYAEQQLFDKALALLPEITRAAKSSGLDYSSEASYQELTYLLHLGKNDIPQAIHVQKQLLDNEQYNKGFFYCRSHMRLANLYLLSKNTDSTLYHLQAYKEEYTRIFSTLLAVLNEQERMQFLEYNSHYAGVLFKAAQSAADPGVFHELMAEYALHNKALLLRSQHRLSQVIKEKNDTALMALFDQWLEAQHLRTRVESMGFDAATEAGYDVPGIQQKTDSIYRVLYRNQTLETLSVIFAPRATWQEIIQTLQPAEAAVDITRFETGLGRDKEIGYAIQIFKPTATKPTTVFVKDPVELETFVAEWYKTAINQANNTSLPQGLYQAIWEPIAQHLQDVNQVFLVADGVYHQLALEDLPHPGGGQVIDHLRITRLLNLSELIEPVTSGTIKNAVLIGNPDYNLQIDTLPSSDSTINRRSLPDLLDNDPPKLTPLPGSQREVNNLSNLLSRNGYTVDVYTGHDATETILTSSQTSGWLYHIATHGYFVQPRTGKSSSKNPLLRSMLFFAGAQHTLNHQSTNLDDGVLTAFECSTLSLHNTFLVTLSACHSGASTWLTGEGAFGLPRAFHMAGAAHTLVSLWEVEDEADQELLNDFYMRLISGTEIHEALRLAKLKHRNKYPAPKYWSGWMLTGK